MPTKDGTKHGTVKEQLTESLNDGWRATSTKATGGHDARYDSVKGHMVTVQEKASGERDE